MTNNYSGLSTAEEFYRTPALACVFGDVITSEQDQLHTAVGREAGTAKYDLINHVAIAPTIKDTRPWLGEGIGQKIFLPRRSDERFGPQQYYYAASKSGVVPSWVISAAVHPA